MANRKWYENLIKKFQQESWGQDVLDTMYDRGESPAQVARIFWEEVYPTMPEQGKVLFRQQYRAHTGRPLEEGENPLDMIDLAAKVEYLEGTDRGFVVLMREANHV